MDVAYVSRKGQLVIPVRIRRKLGIKPGSKVCFVECGDDILFQPITKEYLHSMAGTLKSDTPVTDELLAERKNDRAREEGRILKHRAR
jgi:AbrB family looped-hinge helix DNA binding protein